jgi:hypothetical protein
MSLLFGFGAWGLTAVPAAAADGHVDTAIAARAETSAKPQSEKPQSGKLDAEAFNQAVRKLWEDHVTWTRLFIVSASADLPDLDATTARLLQNQQDIGDAVKPFFGEDAGERLTELLREHILTAADLLSAAKAGDTASADAATTAWYANADEIARFLSEANSKHWPEAEMRPMMREHLDLTLAEAVAHLEGRYDDDVAAYDRVHDAILQMADHLSDGIVAQFPARFTRG